MNPPHEVFFPNSTMAFSSQRRLGLPLVCGGYFPAPMVGFLHSMLDFLGFHSSPILVRKNNSYWKIKNKLRQKNNK